jgi:hypothetical protein
MKTWIKYGLLNALLGLIVSIGINLNGFAIAAPVAAFLIGGLFWKLLNKDKITNIRIVITGILSGSISHYLTFVLFGVIGNIHYWTTGNTAFTPSIPDMLVRSVVMSLFSLLFFGWLTVPYAIIMGFILKRVEEKKNMENS